MIWRVQLGGTFCPSDILGGWGALSALSDHATRVGGRGSRIFLVSDRTVWALWKDEILGSFGAGTGMPAVHLVTPGEASKTVATVAECWNWLASEGARRDDVVVAVGGGVVGDLAGFAAATYLRGLGFWQVPTTLLAQVDSSVGGKVGINLPGGKNLVGAFYQPEVVVADQRLLDTLPAPEFASGLGEVVKYALLSGEPLLEKLERDTTAVMSRTPSAVSRLVEECVRLKAEVVQQDERDVGRRAILNLGHTVGHALERAAGFGRLSHGAAVGLGLLVTLSVSESICGLAPTVLPRVRVLLTRFALPTTIADIDAGEVLAAVGSDKKTDATGLGFVCLRELGDPVWGVRLEEAVLATHLEVVLT